MFICIQQREHTSAKCKQPVAIQNLAHLQCCDTVVLSQITYIINLCKYISSRACDSSLYSGGVYSAPYSDN